MPKSFSSFLQLAIFYLKLNFKSQSEYRVAFFWQIVSMAINDSIWLFFWMFFFDRFPVLGNWNQRDVVAMWSVLAAGYGLGTALAGNSNNVATLILKGELDSWLLYPRAVLPHLLLGRMSVSSWGDFLFGVGAYLFLVHPSIENFLLFALLVPIVGVTVVGFSVGVGSLGFFLGSAETISENLRFALITFGTYPPSIFSGAAKILLYTVVPAGICSYLPVEALRQNSLELALLAAGGSLIVLFVGSAIFYAGLAKYESGSLIKLQS
jgi:ABC-2 type transport system permease protein